MAASHINSYPAQAAEPNQKRSKEESPPGVSILTLKSNLERLRFQDYQHFVKEKETSDTIWPMFCCTFAMSNNKWSYYG